MLRFFLLLLCTVSLAIGRDHVVEDFDVKRRSVAELIETIEKEVSKGATVVRFSAGRWQWHDLSKLGLAKVGLVAEKEEELADLRIKYSEKNRFQNVANWVRENEVKAVQIGFHGELPAEAFFELEAILTKLNIPYSLYSGGIGMVGELRLIESDGNLRTFVPENLKEVPEFEWPNDFGECDTPPKGEQVDSDKPATAPEEESTADDDTEPETQPEPKPAPR